MKGISYRPLSDMESNGVYFEFIETKEDVKVEICEYSGLPSVESYMIKRGEEALAEDRIAYIQ